MKNNALSIALAMAMATSVSAVALAQTDGATDNKNAVTDPAKPNSGPGVQGPEGTRTGPAAKEPGDAAGSSASGTSTGETGTGGTTQPSQDSSGVEGMPGNKSGPAVKEPGK